MNLKNFFNPKSLAIVGASSNSKKLGWQILSNVKKGGYKGKIYPINLSGNKILGLKSYVSLMDIKEKVDLVLIVIPAKLVKAELEKCVKLNIKNIVIISAGFKELNEEGAKLELEIRALAEKNNLNILGPNCLGFISNSNNLNLTFTQASLNEYENSYISLVSQSGAIGSAMLDWFAFSKLSLANFISLGNKVGLAEDRAFDYLREDNNTKLVVAYLEEIGDGKKLRQSLSKLAKKKPVIVIKAGKSQTGAQMALSHTGSLAGSWLVSKLALEHSGAILLDNLEQLFDILQLWPSLKDKNLKKIFQDLSLILISNAGGPLVIAADILEQYNLTLTPWPKKIKKINSYSEAIKLKNPLDILGDALASDYKLAIETLISQTKGQVFILIFTPQSVSEPKETAELICDIQKKYSNKLFIPVFIGGKSVKQAREIFNSNSLSHYDCLEPVLFALAKYKKYISKLKSLKEYIESDIKDYKLTTKTEKRQLTYLQSLDILKSYKINIVETKVVKNKKDLKKLKFPLVLKAVGEKLIHKTEEKAVRVNIRNFSEAEVAYDKLKILFKKGADKIVSQAYIENNLELIVGFKRDKKFGTIFMIGWGGIYAEIIKDTAYHLDYLNKTDILEMLNKLKVYKLISGYRGKKYSQDSIIELMLSLSNLAKNNLEIQELDINPVFLSSKKAQAGDVRIIV